MDKFSPKFSISVLVSGLVSARNKCVAGLLALSCLAGLCDTAPAQTILFQDDFARGTAESPVNLDGSQPAKGREKWTGPRAGDAKKIAVTDGKGVVFKTVGSSVGIGTVLIDGKLAANSEYVFKTSISSFNNKGDSWISVGLGNRHGDDVVGGVFLRNEGGNWIMQKEGKVIFQELFDRYSANDPTNPQSAAKIKIVLNTTSKGVKFYLGDGNDEDFSCTYTEMPPMADGLYGFIKFYSGNGTENATNSVRINSLLVTQSDASAAAADLDTKGPKLLKKIADEYTGPLTEDSKPQPGVPKGEFIDGTFNDSKIYPGSENHFKVYVPAQYKPGKPACVLIKLDGIGGDDGTVLDNLIAKGDIPITIAVGISSGAVLDSKKQVLRYNRSYEFDSVNDHFPNFVLEELLPKVEALTTKDGRPIRLSRNGNDRATTGGSTGGIGAFTLAWRRPDAFSRVYSVIGTFVSMRGGHEYPALIRKTEAKPIRIFLEDGTTDAWNLLFGSWFTANENMEAALSFAGYDVQHIWGEHGHDGRMGNLIYPDVLRWLWRDWPKPLRPGRSQNDMLRSILVGGEGWQPVGEIRKTVSALASNQKGEVFFSDSAEHAICKIGADNKVIPVFRNTPKIAGQAFGPDGSLYVAAPDEKKILVYNANGKSVLFAEGVKGHSLVVNHDGNVYVTEPGAHSDEPSKVWLIKAGGQKSVLDEGLSSASGLAFLPDKQMFFVAEATTKWVYSYAAQPDGTLLAKESFYWLHMTDIPNDSGAQEMAMDKRGNLYVATRMGIQICDRNGRVRGILPLPTPSGPAQSLCWAGDNFDTLVVTDGQRIFKRKLRVPGYSQWATPAVLPPLSGG